MANLTKITADIEKNLTGMLDRSTRMQGYLNRVVYRQYQNAQRQRWISENKSEGTAWLPLHPGYKKAKLTRFAAYPGGGSKMMIATSRLSKSVIGPGEDHRKLVTKDSIEIAWSTPYAVAASEVRPFNAFGDKTMKEIYNGLGKFIMEGLLKDLGK